MEKSSVSKRAGRWVAIISAVCVLLAAFGVAGVFAARAVREKKMNDHLLETYKAYVGILEDNEDSIKACRKSDYLNTWMSRLSHRSVKNPCCLHDVDGDGMPELLFFTFDNESGSGELNVYSYEHCGTDRLVCDDEFLEGLDANYSGGSTYAVFTSKSDEYLHVYYVEHCETMTTFLNTYKLTSAGLEKVSEWKVMEVPVEGKNDVSYKFYADGNKIRACEGGVWFKRDLDEAEDVLLGSDGYESGFDRGWDKFEVTGDESKSYKEMMKDLKSKIAELEHSSEEKQVVDPEEVAGAYSEFLESSKKERKMSGLDKYIIETAKQQPEYLKPVIFTDLDNDGINELLLYTPNTKSYTFDLRMYRYEDGKVVPVENEMTHDNVLLTEALVLGNDTYTEAAFRTGEDKIAVLSSDINYYWIDVYEYDNGKLLLYDTYEYKEDDPYVIADDGGDDFTYRMNDGIGDDEEEWKKGVEKISEEMGDVLTKLENESIYFPGYRKLEKKIRRADALTMSLDEAMDSLSDASRAN